MHGSLPGLAAGRFGVIMFFSACRLPSFAPVSGGPAVTCIRESNHHRTSSVSGGAQADRNKFKVNSSTTRDIQDTGYFV